MYQGWFTKIIRIPFKANALKTYVSFTIILLTKNNFNNIYYVIRGITLAHKWTFFLSCASQFQMCTVSVQC